MRIRIAWLAALLPPTLGAVATAAENPTAVRPLLKQLNEETQSLYREVQSGVVRVQLPPPKWAASPIAQQDLPLAKWGAQLDSQVKEALAREQQRALKGEPASLLVGLSKASTQPATTRHGQSPIQQSIGAWALSTAGDDILIFRPNGSGSGALRMDAGGGIDRQGQIIAGTGRLNVDIAAAASFTPNNIGLLLDDQGHVLVPVCIEKESFDGQDVKVMLGQGQMSTARFVGADRQTNVTLLKLAKPLGTPVKLADTRPIEGNLTMFLSPNSGVGRLIIWTPELRDWGVVVSMDGKIYGFTRQGQFLSAAGCGPVIRQLLASGAVTRAKLGLGIVEVPPGDAARERSAVLGSRPAVRVEEVAPDSPASRAGLQPGDLILTANNQSAGDPSSFAAAVTGDDPQAAVKLTLLRDDAERAVTIDVR